MYFLAGKTSLPFIFSCDWLFPKGSHYLLVNNDWRRLDVSGKGDWGIYYCFGIISKCYTNHLSILHFISQVVSISSVISSSPVFESIVFKTLSYCSEETVGFIKIWTNFLKTKHINNSKSQRATGWK